jgi:hypothetical protein
MFTIEDVDVSIAVESEHIPVQGNLIVSGDDEFDKKCEDEIISRLDSGDEWAWCCVKVTVTPKTLTFTDELFGFSYLGGCSYENREEFEQSDYYKDMIDWAIDDLNNKSKDIYECLKNKFSSTLSTK